MLEAKLKEEKSVIYNNIMASHLIAASRPYCVFLCYVHLWKKKIEWKEIIQTVPINDCLKEL